MRYPRVLIIAMPRINEADAGNNGLLLRNLFCKWPRENLAQIYSSSDNGDSGFFGSYYQLGPKDRRMGALFYKLKAEEQAIAVQADVAPLHYPEGKSRKFFIKSIGRQILVDTGLYEIIFRPRLSRQMKDWIENFTPDIIFCQGYSFTFALLPLMLSHRFRLPLAYYPTDDWPSENYRLSKYSTSFFSQLVGRKVSALARQLVDHSVVRLTFNRYMQEEYSKRYGMKFSVLMHGDDFARFKGQQARCPERYVKEECWIVCTGLFNKNRMPLLNDLDQACEYLISRGIHVRATVFPVNPLDKDCSIAECHYLNIEPCPSHDELAAILQGADILFLPERFDESSAGIRLSISSKAPLFMFSGKPIVVYSDPITGIARYAKEDGWATVLDYRDPVMLANIFEKIITNSDERQRLVKAAKRIALVNHDIKTIQNSFALLLSQASFRRNH